MNNKMNETNETIETIETIESIAWKLLFDHDVNKQVIQFFVGEEFSNDYEKFSITFEILISIFMEMIISSIMIKSYSTDMVDGFIDDEKVFNYKLNFGIDEIQHFKDKISKFGYQLCFHEVSDHYDTLKEYYCKILFKKGNEYHFEKRNLDKEYTFLLRNDKDKSFSELKEFYAITEVDGKKLQIYFDTI